MVADNRVQVCATCVFFDRLDGPEPRFGLCRRNPPLLVEQGALNGGWPVIEDDDWCGEHDFNNDIPCM